jgi:hypothetical protein
MHSAHMALDRRTIGFISKIVDGHMMRTFALPFLQFVQATLVTEEPLRLRNLRDNVSLAVVSIQLSSPRSLSTSLRTRGRLCSASSRDHMHGDDVGDDVVSTASGIRENNTSKLRLALKALTKAKRQQSNDLKSQHRTIIL